MFVAKADQLWAAPVNVGKQHRLARMTGRLLLALCVGLACAPCRAAADADLSGTMTYVGALGPVAATRPVRLLMYDDPFFGGALIASATVTANGDPFVLTAGIDGDYYLFYWLDLNNDFVPSVGEPFELSGEQLDFPAAPVAVPQSGLALAFGDDGVIAGIAGTVTYTGAMGPVSGNRTICVCAYTNPELSGAAPCIEISDNGARYDFITFATRNPAYLLVFLDVDQNLAASPGEPFVIYNNKSAPPADAIVPSATQTGVNFIFGDERRWPGATVTSTATPVVPTPTPTATASGIGTATATSASPSASATRTATATPSNSPTPTVSGGPPTSTATAPLTPSRTPSRTRTPTAPPTTMPTIASATSTPTALPCIGDCDSSGTAAANDVLLAVQTIATGTLDQCPSFDCHGDSTVHTDCLDRLVGDLFAGCRASPPAAIRGGIQ